MTFREFILSRVQLFFFLVTLILAASAILGGILMPEKELHYYHLFSPFIIAGLCTLPSCVTYFRREPTLKQYIFRLVTQFLLTEGVVMLLISPPDNIGDNRMLFYFLLGGAVLIIYVLATLMMWYQKYLQSRQFTQQLKKLQASEN